jgi:hypothetical protein
MPGPPMGGGGPAAGTTAGDAMIPWLTLRLSDVTPTPLSGDSNIPTGEELGVPPGVPAAGEPPEVVVAAAEAEAGLESPSLLSSERM